MLATGGAALADDSAGAVAEPVEPPPFAAQAAARAEVRDNAIIDAIFVKPPMTVLAGPRSAMPSAGRRLLAKRLPMIHRFDLIRSRKQPPGEYVVA